MTDWAYWLEKRVSVLSRVEDAEVYTELAALRLGERMVLAL